MYNEKEIKKILERASELQKKSEGPNPASGIDETLTLEEIEEIARESGLSSEYVRQAAIEYDGIPVEEPIFLDMDDNHSVELIGFAKGELNPKAWAELRSLIEYHFNNPGKVRRRPEGIIWQADPKGISKFFEINESPSVEVRSIENKSTIHLRRSLKTYNKLFLYPAYLALAGTFALITIAFQTGELPVFFIAALVAGISKFFFQLCKNKKTKEKIRLKDLMEQLQVIITRRFSAFYKRKAASGDKFITVDEFVTEDENVKIKKRTHIKE